MGEKHPLSDPTVPISIATVGGVVVARVECCRLCAHQAAELRTSLGQLAHKHRTLVIDLSGVEYADWIAFEVLLEAAAASSGKIRLAGSSPSLQSLFLLSHLPAPLTPDDWLGTAEAAVEKLAGRALD